MPHIKWEDRFSVGIPSFDEQHQELIAMINRLYDVLDSYSEEQTANEVLVALASYTQTHFVNEERAFEKYGYPEMAPHKALHDAFVAGLQGIIKDMLVGKALKAGDMLEILKDWLINHILKEDMKYSEFLVAKGVR